MKAVRVSDRKHAVKLVNTLTAEAITMYDKMKLGSLLKIWSFRVATNNDYIVNYKQNALTSLRYTEGFRISFQCQGHGVGRHVKTLETQNKLYKQQRLFGRFALIQHSSCSILRSFGKKGSFINARWVTEESHRFAYLKKKMFPTPNVLLLLKINKNK